MSDSPSASTAVIEAEVREGDRKSTRLNSSHSQISYAVFCLKKNNADRPGAHHVLLHHDADLAAQTGRIEENKIDALHQDAVAYRHIKTLHQLGQRRALEPGP